MGEWQRDYLFGVKPSTKRLYEESIRLYILPHLGEAKLDQLSGSIIQRFYNDLLNPSNANQRPICAKSVKNVHGILHRALQQAVKNGLIRLNPSENCVLPRVQKKEMHPLSQEQMRALFELLPGHPHEYLYAMACIESGVDIKTLQENLGHATAAFTLEVYGHVSRQMQISSANKLESFIQSTFSVPQPLSKAVGE